MGSFDDVERFAKEHGAHGTLTPSTSNASRSGYQLTLVCTCGTRFSRWVSGDDTEKKPSAPAKAAPAAPPAKPAPPPSAPRMIVVPDESEEPEEPPQPVPSLPSAPSKQSLEDAMREALEALDSPARPPAPPPTPAPPSAQAPPATRRSDPVAPSRPTPPPPPTTNPDLEAAMREALEALEAPEEPPAPAPPISSPPSISQAPATQAPKPQTPLPQRPAPAPRPMARPAAPLAAPSAPAAPARPGARLVPDKQALESALKATLEAFDAPPQGSTAVGRPRTGVSSTVTVAAPRRGPAIAIGVSATIAVLALGAAGWFAFQARQPGARAAAPVARQAPRLRAPEGDRAAVTQAFTALRDLQAFSKTDVQFRMYFNRVAFVKTDVDRNLQTAKDSDVKTSLREAMALHNLAANAWRAKTLNEVGKWEALGDDPTVELCPAAKRMVSIDDPPPNMTRPQWRGITLASGVPVLWDCAAERITDVERALK